jgi:hypothetical protein
MGGYQSAHEGIRPDSPRLDFGGAEATRPALIDNRVGGKSPLDPTESEYLEKEVYAKLSLVHASEMGELEGLTCPECDSDSVGVWFEQKGRRLYYSSYVCENCSFRLRVRNSGCPAHFREDRVRSFEDASVSDPT